MTHDSRPDERLRELLGDIAPSRAPDRLRREFLTSMDRVQPRSRWLALIKEPSMRLSSRVAVGSPTVRLAYMVILTTLLALLAVGGVVAGASLVPSPAPQGCGEVFCPGGSLNEARSWQTATRLLDGRVLVLGGAGSPLDIPDNNLATAEVWDPKTGTASPTGPLHDVRAWHTATLLKDGRVLVVGSEDNSDGSTLASAEVWDPKTGTFAFTGSLAVARGLHTATLLNDGRVLIVGGITDGHPFVPTAEIWDPTTGTFAPAGTVIEARAEHTANLLLDGTVLIVGGEGQGRQSLSSAELWDPASMTFSPAGSLLEARAAPTATLLMDGSVLVVGGGCDPIGPYLASAELWDPGTRTFSPAGELAEARGCFSATGLADGRVLDPRRRERRPWRVRSDRRDMESSEPDLRPGRHHGRGPRPPEGDPPGRRPRPDHGRLAGHETVFLRRVHRDLGSAGTGRRVAHAITGSSHHARLDPGHFAPSTADQASPKGRRSSSCTVVSNSHC